VTPEVVATPAKSFFAVVAIMLTLPCMS